MSFGGQADAGPLADGRRNSDTAAEVQCSNPLGHHPLIEFCLHVSQAYSSGHMMLIQTLPALRHIQVRGMCGTLTWSQHDDFTTPEGDVESGISSFASKMTLGGCMPPLGVSPDPCVTYPQRRQQAGSVCGVIQSGVFQVRVGVRDRGDFALVSEKLTFHFLWLMLNVFGIIYVIITLRLNYL